MVLAEESLPFGILADVGAVVQEQFQLDLLIAGTIEQILHMPVIVGADALRVLHAGLELPFRAFEGQKWPQLGRHSPLMDRPNTP